MCVCACVHVCVFMKEQNHWIIVEKVVLTLIFKCLMICSPH